MFTHPFFRTDWRCRFLVMAQSLCLGALLTHSSTTASAADAQDNSLLTLDRIFGQQEEFKTEDWGPAYWLKDSSGYTTLEVSPVFHGDKGITDIVKYAPASGERTVVVPAQSLIPSGHTKPLKIQDYAWSDNARKVLLFTNTKRVWRRETRGDYWVFDLDARTLRQLGGQAAPSTLMFATFSPDGRRVAYVCQNNLFVQTLDSFRITRLTRDGSDTVVNGTSDWVYEEEFGLRCGFRWSPDSQFLAYWQFDTSGVRHFKLINNTDALYPQVTTYAYPKVGETNSACRVGVVRAKGGPTRWFRANADPRNHYIPELEWSRDSRHVVFQQLNRLQNTNQVIRGDPKTGSDPGAPDRSRRCLGGRDGRLALDRSGETLSLVERTRWLATSLCGPGRRTQRSVC